LDAQGDPSRPGGGFGSVLGGIRGREPLKTMIPVPFPVIPFPVNEAHLKIDRKMIRSLPKEKQVILPK
jgi:hypothetical protein